MSIKWLRYDKINLVHELGPEGSKNTKFSSFKFICFLYPKYFLRLIAVGA